MKLTSTTSDDSALKLAGMSCSMVKGSVYPVTIVTFGGDLGVAEIYQEILQP